MAGQALCFDDFSPSARRKAAGRLIYDKADEESAAPCQTGTEFERNIFNLLYYLQPINNTSYQIFKSYSHNATQRVLI